VSQKELQRLKVVENAVDGRLSVAEAAELLQLSDRQVKRLKQNYNPADAAWVHHGNQGRAPANAVPEDVRDLIIELAKGKYAGFNDSHLHGVNGTSKAGASAETGYRLGADAANAWPAENETFRFQELLGSAVPRKVCFCKSMVAVTIGWKGADLT